MTLESSARVRAETLLAEHLGGQPQYSIRSAPKGFSVVRALRSGESPTGVASVLVSGTGELFGELTDASFDELIDALEEPLDPAEIAELVVLGWLKGMYIVTRDPTPVLIESGGEQTLEATLREAGSGNPCWLFAATGLSDASASIRVGALVPSGTTPVSRTSELETAIEGGNAELMASALRRLDVPLEDGDRVSVAKVVLVSTGQLKGDAQALLGSGRQATIALERAQLELTPSS